MSLGGFFNFKEALPVLIDALLHHQATGVAMNPNLFVVAPFEAIKIFSFDDSSSGGEKRTFGSAGGHTAILNLNSGWFLNSIIVLISKMKI